MEKSTVEELLKAFGEVKEKERKEVIYGVYDSSDQPFWVRISDFFIDRSKISLKERTYFFHLLAVMLDAGIPILQALKVLAKKTQNEHFRRIINTLAYQVGQGKHLSEEMTKFPYVFSEAEIGVVKAGEAAGNLDQLLFRLASELERNYDLRLRIKGALAYPCVVVGALILAAVLVLTFVIPRLLVFFEETQVELPLLTRILVGSGVFIGRLWWLILLAILVLFILGNLYVNTEKGKLHWDFWKLKLPIAGGLLQKMMITKFVRLLSVLVTAGLPINKTLRIVAGALDNELYRLKIEDVVLKVEQGERIAENLKDTPFLFPETVTRMLEIGENSAALDETAKKLSDHYENEIGNSIKSMTAVLEPVIVVIVGLAVAFLALAILGPIFSLSEIA